MALRAKVIGGPLDGLEVRKGPTQAYIAPSGTVSPAAAPNRHFHVLTRQGGEDVYLYSEDSYARCGECGGRYRRAEGGAETQPCPMCAKAPAGRRS